MKQWSNMLLVAGTGRNVGKTTFICGIISNISKFQPIISIKITPHVHEICNSCNILYKTNNLIIAEEISSISNKDSSKMLAAGANKAYYVQSFDDQLEQVVIFLTPLISNQVAVICESAALRKFIEPGLFILMSNSKVDRSNKNMDILSIADENIIDYKYQINDFKFQNGVWRK